MSERYSKIERAYRILEYLRRNSDKEHTITQASLRKNPEISPYVGDKETYNDTIVKLAEALNFDEYAVKPEENWKIIFDENGGAREDTFTEVRVPALSLYVLAK